MSYFVKLSSFIFKQNVSPLIGFPLYVMSTLEVVHTLLRALETLITKPLVAVVIYSGLMLTMFS